MSKHNLMEYALAKDAIADLPTIKKELDNTYKMLYKYQEYLCVSYTLDAIAESLQLLDRQYKAAKKVIESKGAE